MSKKTIYVDMDDTIADFGGHDAFKRSGVDEVSVAAMYEPGFFFSLKPLPGALVGVRTLIRLGYDVQILSQPVAESAHSYSEKVQWIGLHFPELIGKINLSQNKGLFKGDFLIDDNEKKWKEKFEANGGEFIHFDYHRGEHELQWSNIVGFFRLEASSK